MTTRLHQCPSGLMLQVTKPGAGVLRAVAVGGERVVARVEVREDRLGEPAYYAIKLEREGVREILVHDWRDVLPSVCELMTDYSVSKAISTPPSSDDLRRRLRELFELMDEQPRRPGA